MASQLHHEIADFEMTPGELSFEAQIGDRAQRVWIRTESPVTPTADAALAVCLMPAMRFGGRLEISEPLSPKLMREQVAFQAIQRAWSRAWTFGEPPLQEVELLAQPDRARERVPTGRVATFLSGGVDSWATVLDHPEVTDLIFVRGFDLLYSDRDQLALADEVEARMRWAAAEVDLPLHVVETNLRQFTEPLAQWSASFGTAAAAVALFFEPLFDRVLIAGDSDYETQAPMGSNLLVDRLWSTENLEIVDDGGRRSRVERTAAIAGHPAVQQTLRVCWLNHDEAYNCGRCRKCLVTMITLEALGMRGPIVTFPQEMDIAPLAEVEIEHPVALRLWEDALDAARAARRPDLESVLEACVTRNRRGLGYRPIPATA